MFNTLSDWTYNFHKYFRVNWEEILGFLVTCVFASFILTFNEWGGDKFDVASGLAALLVMFVFLLVALTLTVLIIKLIGLRLGYEVYYEPHLLGMMFGLVICVASAGYLPLFIPGGFRFKQPMKLYVGHWRGYERTYYVPALCGAVPMIMLLFVTVLSPIYLATGSALVAHFIVALILFSIYSLIPLPNVALEYGGRVLDFFRYFKGMTFGLAIYINSRTWFAGLSFFVIVFGVVAYVLTLLQYRVGLILYIVGLILGVIFIAVYKNFIEQMGPGFKGGERFG